MTGRQASGDQTQALRGIVEAIWGFSSRLKCHDGNPASAPDLGFERADRHRIGVRAYLKLTFSLASNVGGARQSLDFRCWPVSEVALCETDFRNSIESGPKKPR
jgi:hypothetical protein